MVISKYAIEAYLDRPMEDFRWMKAKTHAELDGVLSDLSPRPYFDNGPLDLHQKAGFLLGMSHRSFYLQYDMGLGKTRIALELFKYRFEAGEADVGIVFAPTDTIISSWREEINKWMPDLPYLNLVGLNTAEKREAFNSFKRGLVLVTYPGFLWMMTELKPKLNKAGKKTGKQELDYVDRFINQVGRKVRFMILDEATQISNQKTTIFVIMRRLAKMIDYRLLLAGRPFGRDPIDLWSQYYIVDRGETMGPTLELFRAAFYDEKDKFGNDPRKNNGFRRSKFSFAKEYTLKPSMVDELSRFLNNRALYYEASEAIDLPPEVERAKTAPLPEAQVRYYEALLKRVRSEGVQENTFLRMRQLSAGYINIKEEDGSKEEIRFPENPKLDLLLDCLDEIPPGKQAIIYTEFTQSGRIIHEALTKLGIPHGWVHGGTTNYDEIKHTFDTTPGYHILANWKKLGVGVNAQAASYVIFFESPTDPEKREQCKRRARRRGSIELHSRIFMYDLIITGSKDQAILDSIEKGDDLYRAVMKQPRLIFGK